MLLSEWENFTKIVFKLGASEAYLEYYKDVKLLHKPEPSEDDLRKKVIQFASKRASYEEQSLPKDKREGFHAYFESVKGCLEGKHAEPDLEEIVQKWYNKLKKDTK
jgi:hypothetical protein